MLEFDFSLLMRICQCTIEKESIYALLTVIQILFATIAQTSGYQLVWTKNYPAEENLALIVTA